MPPPIFVLVPVTSATFPFSFICLTRRRRRHETLLHTSGLNAEVFDALILMAAGSWEHERLREGHRRVMQLTREMDEGRQKRLRRLGFNDSEAAELSSLHTRNFM